MAGLGWKQFNSGEVLTAANLQGYAVDQSVMSFATSAARTSALAAPSEGMVTYLADDDRIEIYDGTAYKIVYLPPTSYVPTATNYTRTSGSLYYSVAGHTMFISGRIVVSAVSGIITFSLPTGFTVNSILSGNDPVGQARFSVGGVNYHGQVQLASASFTTLRTSVGLANSVYLQDANTSATVPGTWGAGNTFSVNASFPLA
jgi:hypothetical protein